MKILKVWKFKSLVFKLTGGFGENQPLSWSATGPVLAKLILKNTIEIEKYLRRSSCRNGRKASSLKTQNIQIKITKEYSLKRTRFIWSSAKILLSGWLNGKVWLMETEASLCVWQLLLTIKTWIDLNLLWLESWHFTNPSLFGGEFHLS